MGQDSSRDGHYPIPDLGELLKRLPGSSASLFAPYPLMPAYMSGGVRGAGAEMLVRRPIRV